MSRLSVADQATMRTRLLSEWCTTCVFRPGNPMRLAPGRLAQLVASAQDGFVVCHDTLPGMSGVRPAVCRGFFDRYPTQPLQIAGRLWGFLLVAPPGCPPPRTPLPRPGSLEPGRLTRGRRIAS